MTRKSSRTRNETNEEKESREKASAVRFSPQSTRVVAPFESIGIGFARLVNFAKIALAVRKPQFLRRSQQKSSFAQ